MINVNIVHNMASGESNERERDRENLFATALQAYQKGYEPI